ncbi:hypothetical protein EJB05_29995, partial [Eragrostis curvula]
MNSIQVSHKCIGDGDGFTAYVDTTDPRVSATVPLEVHELVIARTKARNDRDYQTADALLNTIGEAGYKIITISGEEILARKYRIRMRGIDAPELKMPYGKESKNALMKLIGGRSVTIYVYGQDQFGRYVGDIYCDNVFVQEQMLKCGHAHHFKTYDKRPEFAKVGKLLYQNALVECPKIPTVVLQHVSGRKRQKLQTEGFGHHKTLRNHGIGEESSAMGGKIPS